MRLILEIANDHLQILLVCLERDSRWSEKWSLGRAVASWSMGNLTFAGCTGEAGGELLFLPKRGRSEQDLEACDDSGKSNGSRRSRNGAFCEGCYDCQPRFEELPGAQYLRGDANATSSLWTVEGRCGTWPNWIAGRSPFLIVIDGLDECDHKGEVEDLIDSMLTFFDKNSFIPLRVFITSRVEQHIQSRLNVPGVRLDNLVDHCSNDDISAFLDVLFQDARRRNPVIQAYVRERGEWPNPSEKRKLVEHIGGSFIFASAVFKFIMGSNAGTHHQTTPMDHLPLALKMNPGLDGLYSQTLARSEHLPHLLNIISTIALLRAPLPTSGIAELLGIHTYEVINVLVNLQAIVQVPGTDDIPVTLCHTSLRDFLTNQSRAGRYFAHPRHHVRLYLSFLELELKIRRRRPLSIHKSECTPAVAFSLGYPLHRWDNGRRLFELSESDSAIRLCREALGLHPGSPELVHALADAIYCRAGHTASLTDFGEAISMYRQALLLQPSLHGDCWLSLNNLGNALQDRFLRVGTAADLDEAISLYCQAVELLPSPHPDRSMPPNNLGVALLARYQRAGAMADLREAISLAPEGLELRPAPHPERPWSLDTLAGALRDRSQRTGTMADLEEAISLYRETLNLRPSPHPFRSSSLNNLGNSLLDRHRRTGAMTHLKEAISLNREALELRPSPHPDRPLSLNDLGNSLLPHYRRMGTMANLEEAISLYREALELQRSSHPDLSPLLDNLCSALLDRYRRTGAMADLTEAISLYRKVLELRPSPHPQRLFSLNNLGHALLDHYRCTGTATDIEEAISLYREALELRPSPHGNRSSSLNSLGCSLLDCYQRTGAVADLKEAVSLYREGLELRPYPHPGRSDSLRSLSISLRHMYEATHALPHLQQAITHCNELLDSHYPVGHKYRVETLNHLASLLQKQFNTTRQQGELARIKMLMEEAKRLSALDTRHLAVPPGVKGVAREDG
ncbi:hypothetical protein EST38_g11923 [Candolleomyces aberdarensis]|uniref:Nephrocystin 3-like N-terminal domain-containing protein n=1 Tax=Candolleomyces aberdarensis TaxID=2316362 RepID=A0A4Q2D5Z9_9AGAR|nr:hypothetical protein EST38_g11923 [Candolleomyces aberdarensis]